MSLTVFVGTFNRTDTLERCIRNLELQDYPLKIVIVDNGSTDPAARALMEELPYKVYWLPSNDDVEWLPGDDEAHGGHGMQVVMRNYSAAMRQEWLFGTAEWFAVCDCDSAPDGDPSSISRYVELAQELGCAVGPHLSLNIHRNYPLRTLAILQGARTLFRERMYWHEGIPYSFDDIDSTFHLFPATPEFQRLQMSTARVGPPYWATHTDWLFDICNPTQENHAYILESSEAASWSGGWIRGFYQAWLRSPQSAFHLMNSTVKNRDDYIPDLFILSWMLQYGHGYGIDLERSREVLWKAMPSWSPCWAYEHHWEALVYENDQSCLGWT